MKSTIPAEQMARYQQSAERLAQQEQTQLAERRQRGLAAAQRAAQCLKDIKTEYATLAGRIRPALLDLDHVVARAERLYHQAQQTANDGDLDGVAQNLHGFYVGIERIFEDIARTVERSLPAGQIGSVICSCKWPMR